MKLFINCQTEHKWKEGRKEGKCFSYSYMATGTKIKQNI